MYKQDSYVDHILFFCRDVNKKITDAPKALMNLCVALILSYVIFLAGITQTQNEVRTYLA